MSELINHKDIQVATNYVLVRPNEQLEKYHLNGKETSIYVGTSFMKYLDEVDSLDFEQAESVDTQAHHWPISGTVIQAPRRNVFYGKDIKKRVDYLGEDITPDDMKQLHRMRDASVSCQCDVEVEVDDEVIFDYMVNLKSYDKGLYFHTDIGTLFLVKYDDLYGKKTTDGIYPLNGNIFFEWERQDKIGSFTAISKEIYDVTGIQYGKVTHIGSDPRYYLQGGQFIDCPSDFSVGDRIMFLPEDCTMLESPMHLAIFDGKEIYTIRRYQVVAKIE